MFIHPANCGITHVRFDSTGEHIVSVRFGLLPSTAHPHSAPS